MEFPITIDSQESFDGLVKDRIKRVEAKYEGFDDIKAKADGVEQAVADAVAAEQQKHADELAKYADYDDLKSKVEKNEQDTVLAKLKSDVAKAKGVPAEVLAGSTKEELEAHADVLKPLITARGPVIPSQGDEPKTPAASDEHAAVRALFGTGDD